MLGKLLIVDDDADFRQELREALDGYVVTEASSGVECLRLLKRAHDIDLVIMDVMMPGVSGTEALGEIRKSDPDLGIIILTGHSSKDVAIEALKGRADDYIEKPVDPEHLNEVIERMLSKRRGDPDIATSDAAGKIARVKRFTEKNRFKKTTLTDAAKALFLSSKYLSRLFKQVTGISFSSYRLGIKIEASKELLLKTGCNVNQVSDKLGYENTESFIRQFKRHTSLTPTEFRKKMQKEKKKKQAPRRKKRT